MQRLTLIEKLEFSIEFWRPQIIILAAPPLGINPTYIQTQSEIISISIKITKSGSRNQNSKINK